MEEVDLVRILDYFKHKIGEIIFVTVCVGIMIYIYLAFIQKPLYRSYTTVILGGTEKDNSVLTP